MKFSRRGLGEQLATGIGGTDDTDFNTGGGVDRGRFDHISLHDKFDENFALGRRGRYAARASLCASHTMFSAAIKLSIISSVCAGEGVSLRRSVPRGTVG